MWGSGKLFWDSWNLNFSVYYDRAKCQERVGENEIKIRSTVSILHAKWWNRKICDVRRARPCVCTARSCMLSGLWFLRFLSFFTLFYFELAFGVNMKVLDNFVRFPLALIWLENVLWILSYDENTPSRSWRNFKEL